MVSLSKIFSIYFEIGDPIKRIHHISALVTNGPRAVQSKQPTSTPAHLHQSPIICQICSHAPRSCPPSRSHVTKSSARSLPSEMSTILLIFRHFALSLYTAPITISDIRSASRDNSSSYVHRHYVLSVLLSNFAAFRIRLHRHARSTSRINNFLESYPGHGPVTRGRNQKHSQPATCSIQIPKTKCKGISIAYAGLLRTGATQTTMLVITILRDRDIFSQKLSELVARFRSQHFFFLFHHFNRASR